MAANPPASDAPSPPPPPSSYDRWGVPRLYDWLITGMFAPFGGIRRIRQRVVEAMSLQPGDRVLELGCGTGSFSRLLSQHGAQVIAVDASEHMLRRARQRAPRQTTWICAQIEHFQRPHQPDAPIASVLFAFVLHELPRTERRQALSHARQSCPFGHLVIVDHAIPERGWLAKLWRTFLLRLEPPSVVECLENGYIRDLHATGWTLIHQEQLASGLAQLLIAQPQAATTQASAAAP